MKKVLLLVFLSLTWLSASAQALVPITWTAYGLTFEDTACGKETYIKMLEWKKRFAL